MKESENTGVEYSRKIFILLLLITLLVLIVIGFSFAVYINNENSIENTLKSDQISMEYLESDNKISIVNAMPTSDEKGMKQLGKNEYFDFTVNSKIVGDVKIEYEIAARKDKNSTIPDDQIKLYLEQEKSGTYVKVHEPKNYIALTKDSEIGTPAGSMILHRVVKEKDKSEGNIEKHSDNYRLRIWLDENASISEIRNFSVTVDVYGKTKNK